MAYIITKTDGTTLTTVPDTETNTDYGITLVGRNYSGYGVFLNDNFISLLENFNKSVPPASPLEGQLWYNPDTYTISLWDDRLWKPLGSVVVQASTPDISGRKIGDIWWDTNEYQMHVWTGQQTFNRTADATITNGTYLTLNSITDLAIGDIVTSVSPGVYYGGGGPHDSVWNPAAVNVVTIVQLYTATTQILVSGPISIASGTPVVISRGRGWFLVGPTNKRSQANTGVLPATLLDDQNVPHIVGFVLSNGSLDAIFSTDPEFTPAGGENVPGFTTIKPGLQLKNSAPHQISKTSLTRSVGAAGQTEIQVLDNTDLLPGDLIGSTLVSLAAGVAVTNVFANNAVLINTVTTVEEDETLTFQRGSGVVNLFHGTATDAQRLGGLAPDNFARLVGHNVFHGDTDLTGITRIGADSNLVIDAPPGAGDVSISNPISGAALAFFTTITTPYNRTVSTTSTQNLVNGIFCGVSSIADILVGDIITTTDINVGQNVRVLAKFISNSAIQLSRAVSISNHQTINFYSTRIRALNIEGSQGRVSVAAPPVQDLDVANKLYVDNKVGSETSARNLQINNLIGTAPTGRRTLGDISSNLDITNNSLNGLSADVALKAYLTSPTFTGAPLAPNATVGTNTAQIATTAFVNTEISYALQGVNSDIGGINTALGGYAPIASPTLTGIPRAPTADDGTNTTQIATTEFVSAAISALGLSTGTTLNDKAPIANPTFTGVPRGPTAAASVKNTQLATTAFVHSVIPAGIIMLWSGSSAAIPAGWALCNGSNGTPDLQNQFVIGAGSTYGVGQTGGSRDAIIPSHSHSATATSTFTGTALPTHTHSFTGVALAAHGHTFTGTALSSHTHSFTGDTLSTTHTHTINDPGHNHILPGDDQLAFADGAAGWSARSAGGFAYDARSTHDGGGQLWRTTDSTTGITLNGAVAGTPSGTNSPTSAGTPSGTNSTISAGTPSGTNSTISAGTPSGAVDTVVTLASTGVSVTNANLPPYYALCYIMKTYG